MLKIRIVFFSNLQKVLVSSLFTKTEGILSSIFEQIEI